MKLKELEMSKDENKTGSIPAANHETQPADIKIKNPGPSTGVDAGDNPEKNPTPNLFEEHIRKEKKEAIWPAGEKVICEGTTRCGARNWRLLWI